MLSAPPDAPLVALPLRFRDRSLAAYEPGSPSQAAALVAARRMADGDLTNLVLVGPPGVGKTHLAAGVANAVFRRQRDEYQDEVDRAFRMHTPHPRMPFLPRWLNAADAIVQMRLEFGAPATERETTTEVIQAHGYRGLLVLDDLGREKVSDWTGEVIYALVNARYEGLRPTIVTSNLTAAELAEGPYWPAISRLAEDGELVKVDGKDWRLG